MGVGGVITPGLSIATGAGIAGLTGPAVFDLGEEYSIAVKTCSSVLNLEYRSVAGLYGLLQSRHSARVSEPNVDTGDIRL
jgi:hypothetical protein